jgi:hypothetical protein
MRSLGRTGRGRFPPARSRRSRRWRVSCRPARAGRCVAGRPLSWRAKRSRGGWCARCRARALVAGVFDELQPEQVNDSYRHGVVGREAVDGDLQPRGGGHDPVRRSAGDVVLMVAGGIAAGRLTGEAFQHRQRGRIAGQHQCAGDGVRFTFAGELARVCPCKVRGSGKAARPPRGRSGQLLEQVALGLEDLIAVINRQLDELLASDPPDLLHAVTQRELMGGDTNCYRKLEPVIAVAGTDAGDHP